MKISTIHLRKGNSKLLQQVSDKKSEIGIGQQAFLDTYDTMKFAALPWMHVHEFVMEQRKPMPIASFGTLINPFDISVWTFSIVSTITIFVVLVVMQKLWSKVSGKASPSGYMFQGDMIYPRAIITQIISFYFQTCALR